MGRTAYKRRPSRALPDWECHFSDGSMINRLELCQLPTCPKCAFWFTQRYSSLADSRPYLGSDSGQHLVQFSQVESLALVVAAAARRQPDSICANLYGAQSQTQLHLSTTVLEKNLDRTAEASGSARCKAEARWSHSQNKWPNRWKASLNHKRHNLERAHGPLVKTRQCHSRKTRMQLRTGSLAMHGGRAECSTLTRLVLSLVSFLSLMQPCSHTRINCRRLPQKRYSGMTSFVKILLLRSRFS